MEILNTESRFGLISIFLHWLSATFLFILFPLGLWMVTLDYYDPNYQKAPDLHKSLGLTFFSFVILRLFIRMIQIYPKSLSDSSFENLLAKSMQALMYLLMLAIPVSGYLISTADGRGISWFGFIEIRALPNPVITADAAGLIHLYLAWVLVFCVLLHSLAAIKHWLIDKDGVLQRMFGLR